MKKAVLLTLLLTALFLLVCLAFAMLHGGDLPYTLRDLLILILLAALAVALLSGITLIFGLLANGINTIHNRLLPDDPAPMRSLKKRLLIFALSLAVAFALYHGGIAILSLKPDDPAEYGSFTSKTAVSSDGRYSARQTAVRMDGAEEKIIRIDIHDNVTGELADSFFAERAFDFWGICWEEDTYNLWIQSGDVGVYCFEYTNGKWKKNN